MKKIIKRSLLTLLVICLTLTCAGQTEVSAASYKSKVTKTVKIKTIKNAYEGMPNNFIKINYDVKKATKATLTIEAVGEDDVNFIVASMCNCGKCYDQLYGTYNTKAVFKNFKLSKFEHSLRVYLDDDSGTHKIKVTLKTNNGKKLIKVTDTLAFAENQ